MADQAQVFNQAEFEAKTRRVRPPGIWWNGAMFAESGSFMHGSRLDAHGLRLIAGHPEMLYDEDGLNPLNAAGGAFICEREDYEWNSQWVCDDSKGMILVPFGTNSRGSWEYAGGGVSIYGDYAVLGCAKNDYDKDGANSITNSGSVWVWKRDEAGIWQEHQRLDGTGFRGGTERATEFNFGCEVKLFGNYLAVATWDSFDQYGTSTAVYNGAIKIYKLDGNGDFQPHQHLDDIANMIAGGRRWPGQISMDGLWLVAGWHNDPKRWDYSSIASHGTVTVFKRNTATDKYERHQALKPLHNDLSEDSTTFLHYGYGVSIREDVIIATSSTWLDEDGLNSVNTAGAGYIYELAGDAFLFARKFCMPTRRIADYAKYCAVIWDDLVVMGSDLIDYDNNDANQLSNAGAATLCRKVGGTWQTSADVEILCEYDNIGGHGRAVQNWFGKAVSGDRHGGMFIGVAQGDYDQDDNYGLDDGYIYVVGGPALPPETFVAPFVPQGNCLGKLLKVQGAISREVKQNSGEILSGGLDLVFDDSDYHFWRKAADSDVQNTPVQVHVYMDGTTGSRLTVHKGKLSRFGFSADKFTISIKDYSYETRTRIVPARAVTGSAFTNVSQNFIDHLPQGARPLPLPYGEFSLRGGACPTILYDTSTISYAASGATIQSIDNVYVGGVTQSSGFSTHVGEQGPDGDVVAWIKFSVFPEGPVTWNGRGIVNDQGSLIENGVDILVDIMQRAGGFTDLDFDSGTMQVARQTIEDYKFAGIVGARGFESLSRVMGELCLSMNARAYFNYANSFAVKILDGATGAGVLDLNTKTDFLDGPVISQSFADPVSGFRLATKQQLGYKFNHQYGRASSMVSVTDQVQSELLGYKAYITNETTAKWIQDDTTAAWLIYQLFERSRRPRMLVSGVLYWDAIEAEVGDLVTITKGVFPALPTLRYDWNQKDFEVVAVALNIAERSIKMSFLEL
ncbi:MAG: hypothetical protein GY847_01460 [Proteobacteria bacterium]|nr:hypothetical protein [Pseudomonadota bacterium]